MLRAPPPHERFWVFYKAARSPFPHRLSEPAARYCQRLPGDVGALLAGEKEHGIGNIFWPANSAYWDLLLILCQDLRSDHAEHRSADYPWRERIHGDLSAGQLLRRHAGKADHTGLRRSVIGLSVEPDHPRD